MTDAGARLPPPLLAFGFGRGVGEPVGEGAVRAGGVALLLGTLAAATGTAHVLKVAFRRPSARC